MAALGEIERHRALVGEDDGVLRLVTAGSVDDGKSTLIGRLLHDSQAILEDQLAAVARASARRGQEALDLSLVTDGLEAEREQGITIDVAYRYFATPRRKFILADSPGHEQYTRNMVTGASTADVAVILIDARKGVLAQTRRHAYLAHLLGLRHVFVAVNKMDLVDWSREAFERIRTEFLAFAAPLAIPDLRFFPLSALRGDMVVARGDALGWFDGPTLLDALETAPVQDEAAALPFRFPVQLVTRGAHGDFRGYAGRVAAGLARPGDQIAILPSGRRSTVAEIRTLDGPRDEALAGDSVVLRLADDIDVARGDVIAAADALPRVDRSFGATLCWLDEEPLRRGAKYLARIGPRTVPAMVSAVDHRIDLATLGARPADEPLAMNDIAAVRLSCAQPVPFDAYRAIRPTGGFILVDPTSNRTVAAGMIA